MKKKEYTKEECIELFSNCKNRWEFSVKYATAFRRCVENGSDSEVCPSFYDWKRPTYEELSEIVKKYKSRNDLYTKNWKLYNFIAKNHWMNDFPNLISKVDEKSKIHCVYAYEFSDFNCVYVGRTLNLNKRDWQHSNVKTDSVYLFAKSHNLNASNFLKVIKDNITVKESQLLEDEMIMEYKKQNWIILNIAKAGSIGGISFKWTKNTCYEAAKKYDTYKDFYTNEKSAYGKAVKNGWIKDYTWLKKSEGNKGIHKRTLDDCLFIAKQYKTKKEFREKEEKIYSYMKYMKWLKHLVF